MPNRIRKGKDATPYTYNVREVALATAVAPRLKDALTEIAQARRVPLKVVIAEALEEYLLAVNA